MNKYNLRLICLILFINILPAYSQTAQSSVTLFQTIEQIKDERISAQNEFHPIQKIIGAPGSKPTADELKKYADAVLRIKNLRYSFGLDLQLRRVYFKKTNNQTQNKLGEDKFGKSYNALIGYKLNTTPPFSAKDIDQASLCLRAMFEIVQTELVLNINSDEQILKKIK